MPIYAKQNKPRPPEGPGKSVSLTEEETMNVLKRLRVTSAEIFLVISLGIAAAMVYGVLSSL